MPYLPQQQQPGPLPFVDEIHDGIHPFVKFILAAIFAVGGYWYGVEHDNGVPVVMYIGLGLILGLVATALLKHLTVFLVCSALVAAAGLGTWFLLGHDADIRHGHKEPAVQTAPAPANHPKPSPGGLLDDLRKATGVQ